MSSGNWSTRFSSLMRTSRPNADEQAGSFHGRGEIHYALLPAHIS
jgi:hypothetical protein